jgi:hypothetical protein
MEKLSIENAYESQVTGLSGKSTGVVGNGWRYFRSLL